VTATRQPHLPSEGAPVAGRKRKTPPDRTPIDKVSTEHEPMCGAKDPNDATGKCTRLAGFGTDHLGLGNCYRHGGAMESGERAITKAELRMLAGDPLVMVDPGEALLWCVTLAAQDLAWTNHMIMKLEKATHRPVTSETGYSTEKGETRSKRLEPRVLDGYILERHKAEDRLARFSKMALDAGVAQRAIDLAEKMAEMYAVTIAAILSDLKVDMAKAAPVIERHLRTLEGTSTVSTQHLLGAVA
jgi:hypothetical protein